MASPPRVMELIFMGLHALRDAADAAGDGNVVATIEKHLRELTTFGPQYHALAATPENEDAALGGLHASRAASEQAHAQAAQLDAHVEGAGAASVQRANVFEFNRRAAENPDHAAAVEQSQTLANAAVVEPTDGGVVEAPIDPA